MRVRLIEDNEADVSLIRAMLLEKQAAGSELPWGDRLSED